MADGNLEGEQGRIEVVPLHVTLNGNGNDAAAGAGDFAEAVGPDDVEVVSGEVADAEPRVDAAGAEPSAADEDGTLDAEEELTNADFGGSDDGIMVGYEERIVEALPELARLAAVAWARSAVWGVSLGLRAGVRVARATVDPQAAAELADGVRSGMRGYAREFLGITHLESRIELLTPVGDRFAATPMRALPRRHEEQRSPELALREQGAELLRQSADVESDQRLHPAFGRILGELAPDEGRILRLLTYEGPQPVVDVRAANLIGVGSQLVEQNLNMVGMQAGCRHADRVPAYLINLVRLGLVCFTDAALDDAIAYQVLEAQPHVMKSIKHAARAKTVHRSLRLTPFGEEFCRVCFPREIDEVQALTDAEADQ